jgi:tripartite-type tricarboxylate transporter receptor subunit TctC
MRGRITGILCAALALCATPLASSVMARADDFYRGKTLEIVVSTGVGADSYDTLTRLVARHFGDHLPGNPTIVVRNMPGAGGILAANELYNVSPRDGTVIGILDQSIYETQLFKIAGLKADVTKMNWVGRIISNNAVLFAWHTATVQKIDDAYGKTLVICSTGSSSQLRWTMLKRLLGFKFQLITGYKGTGDGLIAMERGEVEALSMPWTVFRTIRAEWLRDKKVNVLLQTGIERASDLPDVPRVVDLAKNDEQRQVLDLFTQAEKVGRSWTAPPGLPAERVAELRLAFMATMKDPAFLSDAGRMGVALDPLPGDELQVIIQKSFAFSPAIVARAEALIHKAEQDR